jgi:hypothetical protein
MQSACLQLQSRISSLSRHWQLLHIKLENSLEAPLVLVEEYR